MSTKVTLSLHVNDEHDPRLKLLRQWQRQENGSAQIVGISMGSAGEYVQLTGVVEAVGD